MEVKILLQLEQNRGWNVGFIETEVAVDTEICRAYHHVYSELYWRGTGEDWCGEAVEILHDSLDQNIFLWSSNKNIRVNSQLFRGERAGEVPYHMATLK